MLSLEDAQTIASATLAHGAASGLKPLAVAVIDARGALKAFLAQDGTSLRRGEIALGKAMGAISLGMGGRAIAARAEQQPHFIAAVSHVVGGQLIPVPGGVLIARNGEVVGAVGVSGDTSDNDEAAALAGIGKTDLTATP